MAHCTIIPNAPTVIPFVASILVPTGYVLVPEEIYLLHMTLDSSNLKVDTTIQLKPSTITIDDSNPQHPVVMNCFSKVYNFLLHGVLYYNLVAERFQTLQNADPSKVTALSTNNVIQVNTSLSHSCYECELPPLPSDLYKIDIVKGTEFVITNHAEIIPYNPLEPTPFFDALSDGTASQTIQVPYTLTITPSI
ncbi:MAG: hypothetical protein ACRDDX_08180 [Cellulosilyticaceae bacterium]